MNLPQDFEQSIRPLFGDDLYNRLAEALDADDTLTSVRLNPFKQNGGDVADELKDCCVPWCPTTGRYLKSRPNFTFDPLLHAGTYYVQEASSMFVDHVVRHLIHEPIRMLDLCAAPGGKSTALRAALPEGSLLFSNEPMRTRAQILSENLQKFGHEDVVVTNNYPRDYRKARIQFDAILADVPCSGEGMFRKDPVAVEEWSPENVEICWQRQRRIIADIWPCLKPGGILIYSTCTYNSKEDEENVCWIQQEFGAELLPLEVQDEWNITGNLLDGEDESQRSLSVCHFLPHKTKGEGFFLAALRKPDAEDEPAAYSFSKAKASKKKDKKGGAAASPVSKEHMGMALNWLKQENAERYTLSAEGAGIVAFLQRYTDELAAMKQYLKVIQAGVLTGEVKGKDLIPTHALAMSATLLRQDAFDTEEVSYEQAIAYLRKEAITLPETAPRGYILLTYRNIPLGFVKNIGNRANNLYPQEWRIRSGYLPETVVKVHS